MKREWISRLSMAGLAVICLGCDLFEYHPYETNVKEHHLNGKAIDAINANLTDDDTIRIISMGDSQSFYDELEDFVKSANQRQADFVLLNGDISNYGLKDEFEWIHDTMDDLNMPYVAVMGNHDVLGNGEKIFKKMYGPVDDVFTIKRHRFVLLNTNSREYHFNGRVPDIGWLQKQLAEDGNFDYATVISHVPPFDRDFDKRLENDFVTTLRTSGKINLSLHAHEHHFKDLMPYDDGIRYLITASMDKRNYLLIKLYKGEYSYQQIYF